MYFGLYPNSFMRSLKEATLSSARGGEDHLRCDLTKRANALALWCRITTKAKQGDGGTHLTRAAFTIAFSTPPAAETCAPTFHGEDKRGAKSDGLGMTCSFFCRALRGDLAGLVSASFSVHIMTSLRETPM